MVFMRKIVRLISLCCIAISAVQCGSPEQKMPQSADSVQAQKPVVTSVDTQHLPANPEIETKKVEFDKISTQQKVSTEFSSFVPDIRNENNKLPVILFFDPHASGMLPVEMYKPLAKEFGFILVGSNRSHNGQTIDEAFSIFEKMKKDVLQNLPADASRIYVAGFSGGSRVVTAIGFKYPEIKCVIACGAGIGAVQKLPEPTFDYFGIIGNEDFNMNEMIGTDRMLKRAGFNNAMKIFNGGHTWPPSETMREAFWWLDLSAMNRKTTPVNATTIVTAESWYKNEISQLKTSGKLFEASLVAERATKTLKGLSNISHFENELSQIRSLPDYQKQLTEVVNTSNRKWGCKIRSSTP